jgi:peptidyl-prolyl cis-trans isomerase A (cyclophilin A)
MTSKAVGMTLVSTVLLSMLALPAHGQGNLTNPAALRETAPATYKVRFETSKGAFVVDVNRAWAPNGADRFYNLVKNGFYDGVRFFRVVPGFMVQFGINGDPKVSAPWRDARIKDDPVRQSNRRGTITFATSGRDSRTSQVFINFDDNAGLDRQGFSPFGRVVSGMNVVDSIHSGYGERPDQGRIQFEGNAYLTKEFPRLDFVKKATIVN